MTEKINAYEIAKLAHVSPATVSRVLNHKNNVNLATAQKVEEIIEQLGLKIKKQEHASKLLLLNVTEISNIFYMDVIEGVKAAALANGYQLLIDQTELNVQTIKPFMEMLQRLQVYGLIVLKQLPSSILNRIANNIRVVQCNEFNPAVDLPYVSIDDYAAAKSATDQLIYHGRERICFINGPKSFRYAQERERGYLDALKAHDLIQNPDWNISLPAIKYDIALPVVAQLLSSQFRPDAFFCASDTLAAAVIGAAHQYHIAVPDEISVIGFDNTMISQMMTPSLSTIGQPRFQIGYSAVELFKTYDHEKQHLILNTELTLRESL